MILKIKYDIIRKRRSNMIIEKIKELLAEQLGMDVKEIHDDSNILEDLGADSLDIIEMLMTLEEEYGVTIPDDQIGQVKTVKQVAELIEKCKK